MNASDRQRLKILIILLGVLAATWWVGQRISRIPAPLPETEQVAPAPGSPEAEHLDIPREWPSAGPQRDASGEGRNPFQYGPRPAPEAPPEVRSAPPAPPVQTTPPPPAPPPPPPVPFRYGGYAVVSGSMRASLFGDDQRFLVTEQEVLMGRYRIRTITESFVEVEDLEFNRRQRLPLVTP